VDIWTSQLCASTTSTPHGPATLAPRVAAEIQRALQNRGIDDPLLSALLHDALLLFRAPIGYNHHTYKQRDPQEEPDIEGQRLYDPQIDLCITMSDGHKSSKTDTYNNHCHPPRREAMMLHKVQKPASPRSDNEMERSDDGYHTQPHSGECSGCQAWT